MKAIILAGGSGTRLWPMSRASRPKQFFEVISSEPLIRDTYRRLLRSFPAEKIYFSVVPSFADMIVEHFPDIDRSHILVEPEKRDTGPAMGYVAACLELNDPDEPIVFIPSDHFIADEEAFLHCLEVADQVIQETGKMLDIGIEPTFPSTILGYTKLGEQKEMRDNVNIFSFAGHTEKPELDLAKEYLAQGNYLWHANYYMWTPRKFMNALEKYAPDMALILRQIQDHVKDNNQEAIINLYSQLPKISFDYAVTEKMDPSEVFIIKGEFGWSDIGAWDTLYDRLQTGEAANVVKGAPVLIETEGSLIYAPEGKAVAVLGMKDVVVVDTGDALLVCPRNQAQQVKKIISELERKGLNNHL